MLVKVTFTFARKHLCVVFQSRVYTFSDCRIWDVRSGSMVKSLELESPATSVELSRDRDILTVAHGRKVTFVDAARWVVCVCLKSCK